MVDEQRKLSASDDPQQGLPADPYALARRADPELAGHVAWPSDLQDDSHAFRPADLHGVPCLHSLEFYDPAEITAASDRLCPDPLGAAVRLINEIVLGEETDGIRPGVFVSHYDLYLAAMEGWMRIFGRFGVLSDPSATGLSAERALNPLPISDTTKNFVLTTLSLAEGAPHQVATAFLMRREAIIPSMFEQILSHQNTTEDFSYEWLVYYLDRHNELDAEEHGSMVAELLRVLCGDDAQRWRETLEIPRQAIEVRVQLWSGVAEISLTEGEGSPLRMVRSQRIRKEDP